MNFIAPLGFALIAISFFACDSSRDEAAVATPRTELDMECDTAAIPSELWTRCEAENVAKTHEAQLEQLNPAFIERSQSQQQANRDSFRVVTRGWWVEA